MLPVESIVPSSMETTSLVVSPLVSGVIGIAVLLTGVSLLVPLARRLSLPFTVLIAILGLGVGFLAVFADNKSTGLFLNAIREMNVSSEAFLNIFLPPLLFAGGLTVDVRRMMDDFSPILVLAIIAVFLCTAVVGLSLWVATGTSLLVCMILGSLVATTDTAAVLGIFRDIGAPGRLTTIVEGESLFNDAAAIALFVVLLNILKTAAEVSVGAIFVTLIYGLIGGVLWGYVVARIYCWVIGEFRMGIVAEITLSVSLAYLTFVSSQLMGISGIIAVVVAAMTFASVGRTKLSPGAWETLSVTWRQLDFWSTSLLFVLAAMKAPTILNMAASESSGQIALGVATVFGAALLARAAVLWGILPMLTLAGLSQAISNNYKIVLCWGSLRGAITVALALAVSEDAGVAKEFKEFVFIIAMGYVLATLFISAPTLRPLMKMLSLDKLTPQERLVRDRVMALSRTRVSEALRDVSGRLGFRTTLPHRPAISSESEQGQQKMSHADLAQAGLVVAANREAEMSLEYLQQGKVSRRIAERLRADASAVLDGARVMGSSGGAKGYLRAAIKLQRPTQSFRLALQLYKRLGWTGPLSQEIALRYELLIVKTLLLGELKDFAHDRLAPLIGPVALVEVEQAIQSRKEATHSAMTALDVQYTDFTKVMQDRFMERLAVSFEEVEYRNQFELNLISEPVFEDLAETHRQKKQALERRPPLNLGLELEEMLTKVPMFAGLTKDQLNRLARKLTAEFFTPGAKVIRAGDAGDRMFFIASGELEIWVGGKAVNKLERGSFVGEMALLTNQPRSADVIALGYVQVLVLMKRDFDSFLASNPSIKAQIELQAAERLAANLRAATH